MILGYTFTEILWYFILYSFLGWCLEVCYCTVNSGQVVNRGFMNGPVCPVYGCGMIAILALLKAIGYADVTEANTVVLFIGGMILASAVELIAGWVLMKLFRTRWWDYSMRPFNLGGFICLQFSIAWGIGTVLAIRVLHSTLAVIVEGSVITRAVVKILSFAGINATLDSVIFTDVLLGIAYLIFAVDFIVTLACVIGLNRKLDELDEISKKLSVVSENLSEKLGSKALETDQKLDESRVQASLARAELRDKADQWREERQEAKEERREKLEKFFTEKIQQNYASYEERINEITEMARELTEKQLELEQRSRELRAQISSRSFMGGRRIIKAHPTIRHEQHRAILDDIRKKIK